MLEVHVTVVRFDDGSPVADCEVQLILNAAGVFGVLRDAPVHTEPPILTREIDPTILVPVPSPASLRTTSSGTAVFRVEVSAALAAARRLTRDGREALSSVILFSHKLRYGALSLDRTLGASLRLTNASQHVSTPDRVVHQEVRLDMGQMIVGHTTADSVVVWATASALLASATSLLARVRPAPGSTPGLPTRFSFMTPAGPADQRIFSTEIRGLASGTHYDVEVEIRSGDQPGVIPLARGHCWTDDPARRTLKLLFGSCHDIRVVGSDRWRAVQSEREVDFMLHLGDQIYEHGTRTPWFESYATRYRVTWLHPDVRRALSGRANYMIFDDHEVKDDWGVVDVDEKEPGRRAGALDAYRLFQQLHGPARTSREFHYSFRRGPAACFVFDCRSQRALPPESALAEVEEASKLWRSPESTILGVSQRRALQTWADSAETRNSDVVILACSVPLAWIDVSNLLAVADVLEANAPLPAFGLGSLLGGSFLGSLLSAAAPLIVDSLIDNAEVEGQPLLSALDVADLWAWEPHQRDLEFVLDVAFALANDLHLDGRQRSSPRRRVVIVLSGDVHNGAIHMIRSHDPKHRANPAILQLTSSSLTTDNNEIATELARTSPAGPVAFANVAERVLSGDKSLKQFYLDGSLKRRYQAFLVQHAGSRNYGRLSISPTGDRRYTVNAEILATDRTLTAAINYDLRAPSVLVTPLTGSLQAAPSTIAFGSVELRGQKVKQLVVQNRSNRPILVTVSSSSRAPFAWSGMRRTLHPGEDSMIEVRFAPIAVGESRSTLEVRSDGQPTLIRVQVTGRGREVEQPDPGPGPGRGPQPGGGRPPIHPK